MSEYETVEAGILQLNDPYKIEGQVKYILWPLANQGGEFIPEFINDEHIISMGLRLFTQLPDGEQPLATYEYHLQMRRWLRNG